MLAGGVLHKAVESAKYMPCFQERGRTISPTYTKYMPIILLTIISELFLDNNQ